MNDEIIKYDREVSFLGRNGDFKCKGLEILFFEYQKIFLLYPITSKGDSGRCRLEIPIEELDNVISALQNIKNEQLERNRTTFKETT